jgi:hypothetical protein
MCRAKRASKASRDEMTYRAKQRKLEMSSTQHARTPMDGARAELDAHNPLDSITRTLGWAYLACELDVLAANGIVWHSLVRRQCVHGT